MPKFPISVTHTHTHTHSFRAPGSCISSHVSLTVQRWAIITTNNSTIPVCTGHSSHLVGESISSLPSSGILAGLEFAPVEGRNSDMVPFLNLAFKRCGCFCFTAWVPGQLERGPASVGSRGLPCCSSDMWGMPAWTFNPSLAPHGLSHPEPQQMPHGAEEPPRGGQPTQRIINHELLLFVSHQKFWNGLFYNNG